MRLRTTSASSPVIHRPWVRLLFAWTSFPELKISEHHPSPLAPCLLMTSYLGKCLLIPKSACVGSRTWKNSDLPSIYRLWVCLFSHKVNGPRTANWQEEKGNDTRKVLLLKQATQPPPLQIPQATIHGEDLWPNRSFPEKLWLPCSFYSLATLLSISSPKDPTIDLCSPGVYELFCGQCPAFYLGRTGRSLKKRLSEHKRAYKSAFAEHLLYSGHIPDLCTLKLLHKQRNGAILNALEETEICAALHRPGNHSTRQRIMYLRALS